MGKRVWPVIALTGALLLVGTTASAGQITFHPSGFGPQSYAAWKAHQGLQDSRGNDDQAFYLQKMVPTTTVAAGVALFRGFEGLPAEDLNGLEWKHRTDGHCGAGAPRWNVNLVNNAGMRFTVFLGCLAAPLHETVIETDPDHDWCRDTYPASAIDAEILAQTGQAPSTLTLRNLVIVFDEGPEAGVLPEPAGCPPAAPQGGFVHLDDLTVTTGTETRVWTSANDNGSGGATGSNTALTASELETALDASLSSLLG